MAGGRAEGFGGGGTGVAVERRAAVESALWGVWWTWSGSNRRRVPCHSPKVDRLQPISPETKDFRDDVLDRIWTPRDLPCVAGPRKVHIQPSLVATMPSVVAEAHAFGPQRAERTRAVESAVQIPCAGRRKGCPYSADVPWSSGGRSGPIRRTRIRSRVTTQKVPSRSG